MAEIYMVPKDKMDEWLKEFEHSFVQTDSEGPTAKQMVTNFHNMDIVTTVNHQFASGVENFLNRARTVLKTAVNVYETSKSQCTADCSEHHTFTEGCSWDNRPEEDRPEKVENDCG